MRIYIVLIVTLLLFVSAEIVVGQQCGPGCPACSGKSVGDLLPPATILGSGFFIPQGDEERAVFNVRYGLLSWMDAGLGYSLEAEKMIWSVRLQPIAQDQDGWRPSLILGTGSVQTRGTDQSAFVQFAKNIEIIEGSLGINLAGGYATDLPDLQENWVLGTFSLTLFDIVSPFYIYDGINSHIGLSFFATDELTLTGYMLEIEEPALSVTFQWSFGEKEEE